ncbi:alpha/beta hydrolase [Ponticoccus litoralis]|uniref:Alpha/beta hydrolase n=1 Tax=Ponticoccus litoralis TaxID=422297 RepID=A0AAW9SM00_9RHOB
MTLPAASNPLTTLDARLDGLPVRVLPQGSWRYVLRPARQPGAPLLIAAHGSDRDLRGLLEGLDLDGQVSLLLPYFPERVEGADVADDYKFLRGGSEDYLKLMDSILDDAVRQLGQAPRALWLFGFSGGAQFAQRYALVRAGRLDGLILAAPGGVTLLREDVAWWPGLKGIEDALGEAPDLAGLAQLPTAILIGADDRAAGLVSRAPGTRFGSADADLAGLSRQDKARSLKADLAAHGTPVTYTEIAGVGHKLAPCAGAAAQILRGWLDETQDASQPRTTNRSDT